MTRRNAILLIAAAPGWGFATREFWNEKDPATWSDDERRELLSNSPWAKPPNVVYNGGPGNVRAPSTGGGGGYGGMRRGGRTASTQTINPGDTSIGKQQYLAIVRWETSLPIREASRSQSKDDPLANYILNVMGDLPMLGLHKDEEEKQADLRAEVLKDATKLERKNDPLYVSKVVFKNPTETLFYFPRVDTIFPDDKQVTFTTKLGPIEVKAKFTLKEMMYRGKLEL